MFNNNAWTFFTYDWMGSGRGPSGGAGQGTDSMTLAEIVKAYVTPGGTNGTQRNKGTLLGEQTFSAIMFDNLQKNWFTGGVQLVAGAALPKIMNKLPGNPIRKVNRMLKQIGVGDVVKL